MRALSVPAASLRRWIGKYLPISSGGACDVSSFSSSITAGSAGDDPGKRLRSVRRRNPGRNGDGYGRSQRHLEGADRRQRRRIRRRGFDSGHIYGSGRGQGIPGS